MGWQAASTYRQAVSQNIVFHQCGAYGHHLSDFWIPRGRWKKVISKFQSSTSAEKERVSRNSIQIAVIASHTSRNHSDHFNRQATTEKQAEAPISRPRRTLRKRDKGDTGGKPWKTTWALSKSYFVCSRERGNPKDRKMFFVEKTKLNSHCKYCPYSFHYAQTAGSFWQWTGTKFSSEGSAGAVSKTTSYARACKIKNLRHQW